MSERSREEEDEQEQEGSEGGEAADEESSQTVPACCLAAVGWSRLGSIFRLRRSNRKRGAAFDVALAVWLFGLNRHAKITPTIGTFASFETTDMPVRVLLLRIRFAWLHGVCAGGGTT